MAEGGGDVEDLEQHTVDTNTFCSDVKDSGTGDCHKQPSDDAELDDILEGTLSRPCRSGCVLFARWTSYSESLIYE